MTHISKIRVFWQISLSQRSPDSRKVPIYKTLIKTSESIGKNPNDSGLNPYLWDSDPPLLMASSKERNAEKQLACFFTAARKNANLFRFHLLCCWAQFHKPLSALIADLSFTTDVFLCHQFLVPHFKGVEGPRMTDADRHTDIQTDRVWCLPS